MPVLNDTLFVGKKGGMWGKLCKEEERKERVYHGVGYDMPNTKVTLNLFPSTSKVREIARKILLKSVHTTPLRQLN